jgi:hypothetical protein
MRQLFAPGADAVLRLFIFTIIGGLFFAALVVGGVARSSYVTNVGIAPEQPVPFSHKHHSGELGLDCRYCHQGVETTASAGLPPTRTCMTCHSQIWTGAAMLAPVRDSYANDMPLHWVRVNRLPDYVYFNHAIHVAKGVGCTTCHGNIDSMQLTSRANAFEMSWCLNCHRNPAPYLRTPENVFDMHWKAAADQASLGQKLIIENHIRSPAALTDCSICHR